MKRTITLLLALCLTLCGCAGAPDETQPPVTLPAPTQTEPAPTETDPLPTETEPAPTETEPVVVYTNPLTGEAIDAPTLNRPYCVVFNNSIGAMPQHGVSQADILYETLIEGETRCMGVFYDFASVTGPLGSIRSARRDFIRIAMAYDAIFVHAGRSDKENCGAKQYFEATGWDHIDGVHGPYAEAYYYRDPDRTAAGYQFEHTLFIDASDVMPYAQKMGCTMTRAESADFGYHFDDDAVIVGQPASKVTAWFNMGGTPDSRWHKFTTFTYNPDTHLYEAWQHRGDYVDGNTGETLSFRNVLVLRTGIVTLENELMKIDVVGSGTGYYACNGQIVPILWSRASEEEPYVYTLTDGTPLTFGVGKSYIAFVPNNATVEYE